MTYWPCQVQGQGEGEGRRGLAHPSLARGDAVLLDVDRNARTFVERRSQHQLHLLLLLLLFSLLVWVFNTHGLPACLA